MNPSIAEIIEKLKTTGNATDSELLALLTSEDKQTNDLLAQAAVPIRIDHYGDEVYLRGLIEFTNYCKNNCYYCGIRAGNTHVERYRLTKQQILDCCVEGYQLGYRTFVLQGGEDPYFTDDLICEIVRDIKVQHPDCAITLSIGEKSRESYQKYYDAGAERYLLRHETASEEHYKLLHPDSMSLANRKRCLYDLKAIGYQIGSGFMVGSPYQKPKHLVEDLRFLQDLQPDMIGIGPYLTHPNTPFKDMPDGSLELTLRLISILRLLFPYALIPATTALGTIAYNGRERGLKAGGNVVMPNLSPTAVRKQYELYANKICTGDEAAQCRGCLEMRVASVGYHIVTDRGDVKR